MCFVYVLYTFIYIKVILYFLVMCNLQGETYGKFIHVFLKGCYVQSFSDAAILSVFPPLGDLQLV